MIANLGTILFSISSRAGSLTATRQAILSKEFPEIIGRPMAKESLRRAQPPPKRMCSPYRDHKGNLFVGL
jgi:hypothetical protein